MTILNGTTYDTRTPHSMCELLERLRHDKTRCRFYWGDTYTGLDWNETYSNFGTIGRSMGPTKILILLHNINSTGGPCLLDRCIVRIRHANKKNGGDIYCHPHYHLASI